MSYSHDDSYGLCKGCFKQKSFCTCEVNQEFTEHTDQTFSEQNPQCQSIGEQEQQQTQEQGGLEQQQGPQTQEQIQEGQHQGPQTQEQQQGPQTQGNQSQGPQTQGPQTQGQNKEQEQQQGPQDQDQRHGDQTMTNDQSISTPVDVDGVTVDTKCGDCKPIIIFDDDFFEKRKSRGDRRGEDMDKKDRCSKDCDCCVRNLADLLREVQVYVSTLTDPADADKAINIYFNTVSGLANPTEFQVINQVVDCSVLRFRPADQEAVAPNTAVQLCDVAGICAEDQADTPDVYDFLLEKASAIDEVDEDTCKKKKSCVCPCCASGIGEELKCTANYGLLLDVFVKGQTAALPLTVLAVKDCLAYFANNSADPVEICVFSLCSITGFTVVDQTIGTPTP
ncbi:hypothetical protein [Rossellomorea aquimaris]|uniref:hypothetical protein n=1 Tax=Rossellomorea aquimaris TaxID=189382 RepID=UPI001CFCEB17|nr:hypothetical protein [Rossellomorea aquimaris]